mmetsp:Transcript_14123/g.35487  ORF Transcript_14123/g.35487 Transcript_14123/m.35487 type:complete len:220 (-) Transcript_14123:197-856(-)
MEGYGGVSTVREGNNNVVRRDSILCGFVLRHIVPSIFDTNVNHFVVHRTGHRIRYGSCVGGLVFHNETSVGIRLVVASVPFLVGDAFTEQTDRNETRDRTPSGQWRKGGLEQLWITCPNPHDESHYQKVHVSKFAKLVFDGNGKKVQKGVLGGNESVVASREIGLSRNQQTVAPVFLSELDNILSNDGGLSASAGWRRVRWIIGRHGAPKREEGQCRVV